jgi:hypothetical protein
MSKAKKPAVPQGVVLSFEDLVRSIRGIDAEFAAQAGRAVNVRLTLRNWLIGGYIAENELRGNDRAAYGGKLLDSLASELGRLAVSNSNRRQLYRYLRFYRTYPGIVGALPPQFRTLLPGGVSLDGEKVGTPSPQSGPPAETLLNRLSYSHLELIVDLDVAAKRDSYAAECLRGNWSVRELKRQIASLYFERSDLSRDKAKLTELADAGAEPAAPRLDIRDPYVFEVRHDNRVNIADTVSRILGRRCLSRPTYLGSKDDGDHSLLVKRRWATKCPDPRAARLAKHGEGSTA